MILKKTLIFALFLTLLGCQSPRGELSAKLLDPRVPRQDVSPELWLSVESQMRDLRAKQPNIAPERLWLQLGKQELEKGSTEIAAAIFDQVMTSKQATYRKEAWNAKAILAQRQQRPYEAEAAWLQALGEVPDDSLIKRNLGYFYLNYAQFQKVIDLYPEEDAEDYHSQLQLLIAKRNLEESKEVDARCEALLRSFPRDSYVLYNCALHEFQNNRHASRAGQLLEKALQASEPQEPMRVEIQAKWKEVKAWESSHQSED